ncbi:MAG: FdhF/YdeP family oxidoreductase [Candidatus Hydrogenedentes bacterium]|jgi:molybdopterin-dependent oxidoreductase alpha subunit|nr:FdhF/YdeP family oxidoreductase [Candidatus Hydrogenedentota bacterium]
MIENWKPWNPANWVSLKPFGFGEQRPNNYGELLRAFMENRHDLPHAWRILSQGVCDGCALGATGIKDWTLGGIHLCNIRLRLLRLNTMPVLNTHLLQNIAPLKNKPGAELRDMGRLPNPMIRRKGDAGFSHLTWKEALDLIGGRIQATSPDRTGYYLTSRGIPNETYYVAQKCVRAMGSNNIDSSARLCHSPSTVALKQSVGAAASTCSYKDWLEADLLVFVGSNLANNQPEATKYIHYAKKNGARVAVVNAYREPGMENYWIPSVPESALFGTRIADDFFLLNIGSDIAFFNGAMKHMLENNWCDERFIAEHTTGVEALRESLAAQSWEQLEASCGASREEMRDFAKLVANAEKAVFVWGTGVTQHERGVDNVLAIVNMVLSKGFVGRPGCGLMPVRGHSGVQGGAEMGASATAFPGGKPVSEENAAALSEAWAFDVPTAPGMNAPKMIDAAHRGELDVLFSVGGNFLEVLPDPAFVEEGLARVPLRVHMDIILTNAMLVDPSDTVLILPAATRYEIPGGVTETSTERRVIFSPEIEGPAVGESRPEWEVFEEIARRVRPDIDFRLLFDDTRGIRAEIANIVPFYDGIQRQEQAGDQFQYGGSHLCKDWAFGTEDGKARFAVLECPEALAGDGTFAVATRRGKQFNTLKHEYRDAISGAERRDILMAKGDARKLDLREGDLLVLRNGDKEYRGRIRLAPVKPGNLEIYWPEGNALFDRTRREPQAGVPDYNAVVTVEKA